MHLQLNHTTVCLSLLADCGETVIGIWTSCFAMLCNAVSHLNGLHGVQRGSLPKLYSCMD